MGLPELPKLDCTPHVFAAMNIVGASSQFLRPLAKQEIVSMKHTERKPGQEAFLMENI